MRVASARLPGSGRNANADRAPRVAFDAYRGSPMTSGAVHAAAKERLDPRPRTAGADRLLDLGALGRQQLGRLRYERVDHGVGQDRAADETKGTAGTRTDRADRTDQDGADKTADTVRAQAATEA